MADDNKSGEGNADPIAEMQVKLQEKELAIKTLSVERDNYKEVALKRKGKLESDESFFGTHDEKDIEDIVSSKVQNIRKDHENELARMQEQERLARIQRENEELKLALQNKPQAGSGGSSGGGQSVVTSPLSKEQEDALMARFKAVLPNAKEETYAKMREDYLRRLHT